jgi:hypothetical protein
MAFTLFQLLSDWENIGFFHVALPFLLIFTLIFAVLQKTKILGTGSKNFNAIVAFIIGALAVRNQDIVFLIQRFLPNISMFVVIALMFLLLVGIFGGDQFSGFAGGWMLAAAIISFIFVGWALTADSFFAPPWLQDLFFLQDVGSLTLIGATALVIWLVVREPGQKRAPLSDVMDWFTRGKR